MTTLPIENAKKFTDLSVLTEAPDSAVLLIHDGTGVKQISAANLKKDVKGLIDTAQAMINAIATTGAGAHNAIYRGKYLGSAVTEAQYAAIAAGTFEDMYIGATGLSAVSITALRHLIITTALVIRVAILTTSLLCRTVICTLTL